MSSERRGAPIPTYKIDLGLPPERRYAQVSADFGPRMRTLEPLVDEVLLVYLGYKPFVLIAKLIATVCLRRVFDREQTLEIRSIAASAGVSLYLMIMFNTLLDILLGCTSGAALVRDEGQSASSARLMHFRTLDWGMPELRDLLVRLEYVNSKSTTPNKVVARSITYAGFVGTLTGVRVGFSLALNHRPLMEAKTWKQLLHNFQVILGFKESISSLLRKALLSPKAPASGPPAGLGQDSPLTAYAKDFARLPTSRTYLIFSTPAEVLVIYKDFAGGRISTSKNFLVQTNHDADYWACCGASGTSQVIGDPLGRQPSNATTENDGEEWMQQSKLRQDMLRNDWMACTKPDSGIQSDSKGSALPVLRASKGQPGVTKKLLEDWLRSYPVNNEYTHFAAIMDPANGSVVYLEKGLSPQT